MFSESKERILIYTNKTCSSAILSLNLRYNKSSLKISSEGWYYELTTLVSGLNVNWKTLSMTESLICVWLCLHRGQTTDHWWCPDVKFFNNRSGAEFGLWKEIWSHSASEGADWATEEPRQVFKLNFNYWRAQGGPDVQSVYFQVGLMEERRRGLWQATRTAKPKATKGSGAYLWKAQISVQRDDIMNWPPSFQIRLPELKREMKKQISH